MPKILIADDEADVRDLLQEALTDAGFTVKTVPDGGQAVVMAAEEPFDLIMLDMIMPGMDGIQTIRVLRKVAPVVPILGLTGYIGRGYMAQAAALGVSCLSKPINLSDLLSEIKDILKH